MFSPSVFPSTKLPFLYHPLTIASLYYLHSLAIFSLYHPLNHVFSLCHPLHHVISICHPLNQALSPHIHATCYSSVISSTQAVFFSLSSTQLCSLPLSSTQPSSLSSLLFITKIFPAIKTSVSLLSAPPKKVLLHTSSLIF